MEESPDQAPVDTTGQETDSVQAPVAPVPNDYADQLEEVYQQVEVVMRELADQKNQNQQLQRAAEEARDRETQDYIVGRRYRQLLNVAIDVVNELRAETHPTKSNEADGNSQQDQQDALLRLEKAVATTLQRLAEVFSSQGIVECQAQLDMQVDLARFEVAGVVEDDQRAPGIVVRAHRPVYLAADKSLFPGGIIRKGAAIVTKQREPAAEPTVGDTAHAPAD